jgi:hypothetical protein
VAHTTHAGTQVTAGRSVAIMSGKIDEQGTKAKALLDAINDVNGSVNASKEAYDRQTAATIRNAGALNDQGIAALKNAGTGTDLAGVQGKVTDALDATSKAANALTQQMDLLNGRNIDAMSASLSFKDSVDTLTKSFQTNGATIDDNSAAGRANLKTILDQTAAAGRHKDAIIKQTGAAAEGWKVFEQDTAALANLMRQSGVSEDAIKKLTDTIWQIPNRDISIGANTTGAHQAIGDLRAVLDNLHGKTIYINTVATGDSKPNRGAYATGGQVQRLAAGGVSGFPDGGPVSGPGTTSSDSIDTRLSDREYVIRARSADRLDPVVLDSLNSGDFNAARNALDRAPGVAPRLPGRGGGSGGGVVHHHTTVNLNIAGSVTSEGDLLAKMRTEFLRYAGRNPNVGFSPGNR